MVDETNEMDYGRLNEWDGWTVVWEHNKKKGWWQDNVAT